MFLFRTILRGFTQKPATNLINLMGLSISLTLVIILSIYSYSEFTTDNYHKNGSRVYLYVPSENQIHTPGIFKEEIEQKAPGLESVIRIKGIWETPVFQYKSREPVASDLLFADEGFFDLFTFKVIEGDPRDALKQPLSLIITKTLSLKLFGAEQAAGRIIKLDNSKEFIVRAVIEEPTSNSCLLFSAITSMATEKILRNAPGQFTDWGWLDFQTFLLLQKKTNLDELGKTILNIIPEEFRKDYKNAKMIPLKKIYFSKFPYFGYNYIVTGDEKKVILLVFVAILVLIISIINFINISSSQWIEKIKQTAVLKILGAGHRKILLNMLGEAFIFFLTALFIAIQIVNAIYPLMKSYTGIDYDQKLVRSSGFIIVSIAITLILSLIFSIIPSLKISSSKAIDNLKNKMSSGYTNHSFNSRLVTLQFFIAIVLISFTLLVQKQVRFGRTNLGFNQKNVVGIKLTSQLIQKKDVLKTLLIENAQINQVAFTQFYPGKDISQWGVEMKLNGEVKQVNFDTFCADAGFFEIMGLHLVKGRLYSDDMTTDNGKVVVNETFIRENNLSNPIGAKFEMNSRLYEIIGIINDFHVKHIDQPIVPLAIRNEPPAAYCLVNLRSLDFTSSQTAISDIKAITSEISPSFPVQVDFLDMAVENMYQSELRFRRTFTIFSGCAIIICSLGILAMVLFVSQRRIKEIGIRRVNGARISEILEMLNKDFVKWVGIAFVLACPVAWYSMYKWLQSFAYKTEISLEIFVTAGVIALGIALLTVSWQSWRAATRNPVESLRYE